MSIDYKILLRKYIEHVAQEEGTTFIDRIGPCSYSDVIFTDEEVKEMKYFQAYPYVQEAE